MGQSIVAGGGERDFVTLRQVNVQGDQVTIGRGLAEAAQTAHGWRPQPADRRRARARRRWFERNWPQHHDRMRGTAEFLGLDFEADEYFVDGLSVLPEWAACSATAVPPGQTEEGRALLARNYDFFTVGKRELYGMMSGNPVPGNGEPPMASRPTLIHSRPDNGPATLVLTMDELDGCMDGLNEHGLGVVLLFADAETASAPDMHAGPQVGLSSVQLPRFVLDTCATAAEAREALLEVKQYDLGTPLHYLIADASGDAFVWERGAGGDEHITDAEGALCVTNHLLHRHHRAATLPEDTPDTMLTFQRYQHMAKRTQGTMSAPALKSALDEIGFNTLATEYPIRTIWRSVLDLGNRTLSAQFRLAEDRRTEELQFAV